MLRSFVKRRWWVSLNCGENLDPICFRRRLSADCSHMAQASKATLTMKDCQEQAANCRKAAMQVMTAAHRIMLEHIADTWDRIAADIHKANQ